mmetsp:Transcript_12643/g.12456  ORF Transcript_12643/g.12456 Transcript_12643/m.12456 type:complete len:82 (+) Transcript_12643:2016-2261(+)
MKLTKDPDNKCQQIQKKLAYEWKNIFRGLNLQDSGNSGVINRKEFERTVHQNGIFLSKEDLQILYNKFASGPSDINYQRVS